MQDTPGLRREEIHAELRRDILSCKLMPGMPLFEGNLAERFAVSKSPIRDALSRLHAEQLVTVMPRKGYQVAPISLVDTADLFEMRGYLEQDCARVIAERASEQSLRELDTLRRLPTPTNLEEYVNYNRIFHLGVVAACPNRRMADTARSLIEQFDRLVFMSAAAYPSGNLADFVAEHEIIITTLQERDGRRAGKLLSQHLARGRKRVLGALANSAIVP